MKTKPFNINEVKPGDRIIIGALISDDRLFIGLNSKGEVVYESRSENKLYRVDPQTARLVDDRPSIMIPHNQDSFDRDGWYRKNEGDDFGEYQITAIYKDGVRIGDAFVSFEMMSAKYDQIHRDLKSYGSIAIRTTKVEREAV